MKPEASIIVIKKRKGHAGHHGGAWKVAYADFVTALMALFIVLWLTSSSEEVKKAVSGYFRDPSGKSTDVGNGMTSTGEGLTISREDMSKLKAKIEEALKSVPELQELLKKQVEMTVTGEGLRIELLESNKAVFFQSGNATPTESARELLASVATELGSLPNHVLIEGHTDSNLFSGDKTYTNWELSADRANAARRFMMSNGLSSAQVTQVRGYADQKLRHPNDAADPSNRRVSIIVQYLDGGMGASASPADTKAPAKSNPAHEGSAPPAAHH